MTVERRDERGVRQADLELTPALRTLIDTATAAYPPERLNPWVYGQFFIEGTRRWSYVKREGGTYTEVQVAD